MTIPDFDHDTLQANNREWWDNHPMSYDWQGTLHIEPGSHEFFEAIDARFFQSQARFGHPDWPDEPPFARQLNYPSRQGQRVLEIGCGMGGTAATMAAQGLDVTAIDITSTAVEMTKRRFELLELNGDIRQVDAEHMPFDNDSFDLVWSWGVIHHSADTEQVVREIYRVLRPGGQVMVMVYHRHALRNWILAGLNKGILRGQLLRKRYDDILREVTDGFIARHLTKAEARQMFAAFEGINITLTDLADLSYLPGNVWFDRYLTGRVIPHGLKQRWDNWLVRHWGWFLYLEATRPG